MFRKALVTAGCTDEHLDTVRTVRLSIFETSLGEDGNASLNTRTLALFHANLKNIFTGTTGRTIAEELLRRGVPTTLIGSSLALQRYHGQETQLCLKRFETSQELSSAIREELASGEYDLLVMCAAVNDYVPAEVYTGKISSEEERLVVEYRRNPKIIDSLRRAAGAHCYIVGFKLLVGVTEQTLVNRGHSQIARASTDLCVGNDLLRIDVSSEIHPMLLIHPEGDGRVIPLEGYRSEVIPRLVSHLIEEGAAK